MNSQFIHPNLHVVLVHFPLALLVCGTLIELFSFLWRESGFRRAGRWMILLGALLGIPTAFSGIYALKNVAMMGAEGIRHGASWNEQAKASPLSDHEWEMLTDHLRMEVAAVALAVFAAVLWLGASDRWRARLRLPLLVIVLVGVGFSIAGARQGGESVYRHGTGVMFSKGESHPPSTAISPATEAATAATTFPASSATTKMAETELINPLAMELIEYYAPPIQLHIILAGCAVAMALAALGLSIRRISQISPLPQVDHIAAALGGSQAPLGGDMPDTLMSETRDTHTEQMPAARFWILAFLLALITLGIGYFLLATEKRTWSANDLWNGFIRDVNRRMAHVIAGGAIVLLTIVLAGLMRWAPRRAFLLMIFALLLIATVAFQVWVGILMLYDTSHGPLMRFN